MNFKESVIFIVVVSLVIMCLSTTGRLLSTPKNNDCSCLVEQIGGVK